MRSRVVSHAERRCWRSVPLPCTSFATRSPTAAAPRRRSRARGTPTSPTSRRSSSPSPSASSARAFVAAAIGRLGAGSARRASWRTEWVSFAAALLAIFSAQELTEGALTAGHPGGLAAVLANGGGIAVPLAFAIAAIVAWADRALSGAERSLLVRARRPTRSVRRPHASPLPAAPAVPILATRPLAFGLARRPPPAPLSA